ncbi:hypothetical protein [Aliivibrio fischeri]|uniref:hypothetical protein n=1 Tax=Aliivibrio fischeri TaxID=668 RepID=UPI0007C5A48A|nr:hypothetical protein [Aliivibrio fischeri]
MKKKSQTGFILINQLITVISVLGLISGFYIISNNDLKTLAGAESSREVLIELMTSLNEHYLLQSNLNNEVDDVSCNNFDVTINDLVLGGFFDLQSTLRTPDITYNVRYIKTVSTPPKITMKEVELTFPNVKLATDYSLYLRPSYQDNNILFFQEPLQAKGKTQFISSLYRDPASGCWKKARNL